MALIIGRKPVLEAINSNKNIEQVILRFGQSGGIINAIRAATKKRNIKLTELSKNKFDELVPNKNSQGVAAKISEREYLTLDELILQTKNVEQPLFVILEEIQDVHNVGAILRTAECANVNGVIITKRNSAPLNETVAKISAGAVEHLKICQVTNLSQTIDTLKQNGYWIVGSSLENAVDYSTIDYNMPTALIMGNEQKGIRRLTFEKCDHLIKIPMEGKIQSLNVSVSTGVILFEILRQRKNI
ncbi:MAG: 23S rRNA (guanosine(2251)-2'-O)-methyltransferase RlmB [Ignavibacteriales bacterium CG12_big_fil_rev_8_21_14_0_65_30_8]|nr:MAG: 23S rRNA (guanosine(2251)-2'-O)-methyltransferase RlmB [Ignavibacteriales bacterium CG12_big_fil_rev_8_21_14_0_65_30_8]